MTAVKEPNSKPASGGVMQRVLGAPQSAWRWGHAHPRAGVAVGFVFVATLAPLLTVWILRPRPPKPEPISLAGTFKELDREHDAEARRMLAELTPADLQEGEEGALAFVQGVLASRQADGLPVEQQGRFSLLAARHFIESRELGFPEDREPQGLLLLGKNLFRAGQLAASLEALEAALPLNEQEAHAIHRMLGIAYLNENPPNLGRAVKHNAELLKQDDLSTEERQAALVDRGEILLRQGKLEDSRAALAEVPATAPAYPDAQIALARTFLAEGQLLRRGASGPLSDEAREKFTAALGQLQAALESLPATDPRRPAALYQEGVCLQASGLPAEARHRYTQVQLEFPASLEAVAAGMQEADLLRAEDRDADALQLEQSLLTNFRPEKYRNPWLTLDELRQRSLGTYQRYFDSGRFEQALQLLQPLGHLLDARRRVELSAAARRAWGESLLAKAEQPPDSRRQANELLCAAGDDFARLAELRFTTREYPDDLWASAECYLLGHDYGRARRMLQTYLKQEPSRRRPLALVRLGECLLLENRPREAIAQLEEALTTAPTDSAVYQGRILASRAHLQLGDTAAAERLLRENLDSNLLTPASLEWRDSLFALGRLLHATNRYEEAIARLDEAVRRYPQAAAAVNARYLIGESYRQQARAALDERDAAVVESARMVHAREAKSLLDSAIVAYDATAAGLEDRELAPAEERMLRNCRYFKAAAQFEMGRFEESIKSYSTAINQYQHAPEVLDAYVRVADCFRRLRRPLEARGTIEQAKVVLSRLPADADFSETSSFDRQEWQRYLEWLGSL